MQRKNPGAADCGYHRGSEALQAQASATTSSATLTSTSGCTCKVIAWLPTALMWPLGKRTTRLSRLGPPALRIAVTTAAVVTS